MYIYICGGCWVRSKPETFCPPLPPAPPSPLPPSPLCGVDGWGPWGEGFRKILSRSYQDLIEILLRSY